MTAQCQTERVDEFPDAGGVPKAAASTGLETPDESVRRGRRIRPDRRRLARS